MRIIESNNETVTLELQREELKDLHHALGHAITELERAPGVLNDLIEQCDGIDDEEEIMGIIHDFEIPAGCAEETVEELKTSLKRAKRLLPKVYDLADGLVKVLYAQK